jgi:hypothetical protein
VSAPGVAPERADDAPRSPEWSSPTGIPDAPQRATGRQVSASTDQYTSTSNWPVAGAGSP